MTNQDGGWRVELNSICGSSIALYHGDKLISWTSVGDDDLRDSIVDDYNHIANSMNALAKVKAELKAMLDSRSWENSSDVIYWKKLAQKLLSELGSPGGERDELLADAIPKMVRLLKRIVCLNNHCSFEWQQRRMADEINKEAQAILKEVGVL